MKRFITSCALVALAAITASWPARHTSLSAQTQAVEPGPLERRANPITRQNPVPRLSVVVMPQQTPPISPPFIVDLRVTLDRQGQVAEVRSHRPGREADGFYISKPLSGEIVGFAPVPDPHIARRQDSMPRAAFSSGAEAFEALVKATMDAVRKWRYEPPAHGPIAFDVSFGFRGTDVLLLSRGVPVVPERSSGFPAPSGPPPSRPQATFDWPQAAVKVGGAIPEPTKVREVALVYPPIAISARVGGDVIVEARIDAGGWVSHARVIRGHPMLNAAAVDAVKRWEFTPSLLKGKAVPVLVEITLTFTAH